jgi:glutamate racemase
MGREVVLVSSADETAFEVRRMLSGTELEAREPSDDDGRRHRFFSSGDTAWFSTLGGRLFGPELAHAEPVRWD